MRVKATGRGQAFSVLLWVLSSHDVIWPLAYHGDSFLFHTRKNSITLPELSNPMRGSYYSKSSQWIHGSEKISFWFSALNSTEGVNEGGAHQKTNISNPKEQRAPRKPFCVFPYGPSCKACRKEARKSRDLFQKALMIHRLAVILPNTPILGDGGSVPCTDRMAWNGAQWVKTTYKNAISLD